MNEGGNQMNDGGNQMNDDHLSDEQIQRIADVLSNLTPRQWDEIQRIVEHLYHPTKTALTSDEISAKLKIAKQMRAL